MTLQICSYQDCYQQRFPCSSITFFQLPTDEPRRTQWILNSGNNQLLNLNNNQKRYFCEVHFQKKDIKPHFYRKLLYKSAIPIPYKSKDSSATTTNTIQYTEFEVVRDDQGEDKGAYPEVWHQDFEINESDYEPEGGNAQTMPTNDCALYDDDNGESILENNVMTEELLDIPENLTEFAAILPIKQESESRNVNNYIDVPNVDATSSTSCISPATTTTTDLIHSLETPNACTTTESIDDVTETTMDFVLNCDKEFTNDLNEPTVSDKSYESDKHFALSLVYYFQRLNAKKKARAKIDILTYLVALEQDKDS